MAADTVDEMLNSPIVQDRIAKLWEQLGPMGDPARYLPRPTVPPHKDSDESDDR